MPLRLALLGIRGIPRPTGRTTLSRLERDGLLEAAGQDGEGHAVYRITPAGRDEVRAWFATPVSRETPPRDELAIKLAMAVTVPGVDVRAVVQRQRTATIRALQDYTRLKAEAAEQAADGDLAWLLVRESLLFAAEAEVRWLDHCEARLARIAGDRRDSTAIVPNDVTTNEGVRR